MALIRKVQRVGGRIRSRLVLLGLLNFAGFALIVAVLILTFRAVEEMTSAAAEGQMARAAVNSSAVRQVAGLYPLTRLLTAALREPDGDLALAGEELRRTVDGIAAGSLTPAARATFAALSEQLSGFVADGQRVADRLAEVDTHETQARTALSQLEAGLGDLRVAQARAGHTDDHSLASSQRFLADAGEHLLALSRRRADRTRALEEAGQDLAEAAGTESEVPPVVKDLRQGLTQVATTAPALAGQVASIQSDLAAYLAAEEALARAYDILAEDLGHLREAEMESLRLMSQLDQDTSIQADRFRQSILDILFTSATYAITLASLVVLAMVLLILVILRRQIREPMEGVIASVNAISGGDFAEVKPMGRGDEWDAIQSALTDMATELSRTYRALADSEARYRTLVDNHSDLVVKLDPERRLVFVNPSLCAALGRGEADLLGRPGLPLLHPDDPFAAAAALDQLEAPPNHCQIEQHTRTPQGWRWYAWAYSAVQDQGGALEAVVGVGRDVTARKDAEAEVEAQRRFLHTVIDAVSDPILVIGADRRVRMANAAAHRLYRWDQAAHPGGAGQCCHQVTHRSALPCNLTGEICPLAQAMDQGGSVRALHRHFLGDEQRYMEIVASPYFGPDGEIEGVVEVGRDITEELAAQERVQFLAHHDVLTGLPNRALLRERFAAAAAACVEPDTDEAHCRVGLLYLDLDHFKRVNDSLGHHIGDLLLQEVARRLSATVRKTDTVSRQGGDEFLIVLPGIQEADGALRVAEHVAAALCPPIQVEGHPLTATFSIGVAVLPDDGTDFDTLLKRADLAMYAAKAAGRNTASRYTPSLERRAAARI